MKITANSPLFRKLSAFVALSETELVVLERLQQRGRSFAPGRDMVHQGQSNQVANRPTARLRRFTMVNSVVSNGMV